MNDQKKPSLTLAELGKIMLEKVGAEKIRAGYKIDPTDLAEVGRQALAWNDINWDGTLN